MAWIKRFFGAADITIDSESGALRTHDDHAAEKIRQALLGTGLPIKLPIIDPGDDGWSAALQPNPITRDCTRLRMIVKDSGLVLSLDGGVTEHLTLLPDMADEVAVAIPAGSDLRIKRYTPDTAITDLVLEVR